MEEDMSSIVSNGGATWTVEAADSTSSTHSLVPLAPPPSKRARHGGCRVSSSTKFKGVVPQQNGHWGAQIYANHQRIWLGTFKSEKEAAMAYDSAAIRIRNGDSHRNFPWTEATLQEPDFQDRHTTDQLLNMIKDGSYQSKFNEFLSSRFGSAVEGTDLDLGARRVGAKKGGLVFKQLFEKELTPSDVGKLNRLVIPKKYAVKHFPSISESNQSAANEAEAEGGSVSSNDDMQLVFHDTAMRSWKFRYCYWKSSQSFVFTRGWNRFVKEKQLRENDTVTFFSCECSQEDGKEPPKTLFVIDVIKVEDAMNGSGLAEIANNDKNTNNNNNNNNNSNSEECVGLNLELKVGVNQCVSHEENEEEVEEEKMVEKANNKQVGEAGISGFRLFGIQIL